jgi:hypothetical protein
MSSGTQISSSIIGNDDSDEDSSKGDYVQTERKSKILPFNPKKTIWRIWSKQFLQRANERGYRDILVGTKKVVSDTEFSTLKKTDPKYMLHPHLLFLGFGVRRANHIFWYNPCIILFCSNVSRLDSRIF